MTNHPQDQKRGSLNKPVLMGCLLFIGVLIVGGIAAGMFVWRNVGTIVKEASETVEKEMREEEEKLRNVPASGIASLSYAKLLADLKANRSAALDKLRGKVLVLSGYVSESQTLSEAVPINLPLDVMIIQATPGKPEAQADMMPCLYSASQKASFAGLKPMDPVKVRGRLSLDKDGDLSLAPCLASE